MAEIKEINHRFKELNTDVYALSTDYPGQALALKQDMDLPFELLCDPDRKMLKTWDLLNPFEHGGVAVPAVVIVDFDGVVCFMSVGGTATRTQLPEILYFLNKQKEDRTHTLNLRKGRKLIIPGPGALWQMTRNFVFQGNAADWRHFFLWPFAYVKILGAVIKKKLIG